MNSEELAFLDSNGIHVIDKIASGGNGEIYIVFIDQYYAKFILKKIRQNIFNQAEIDCMMAISDPLIVPLYKYYRYGGFVYLVMELCKYDLEKYIKSGPNLAPKDLAKVIYNVICAVKACHDKNVAHRDIKPSNFLVDNYERIKIADFGLSSLYTDNQMCNFWVGTIYFMAPELIKRKVHDPMPADIWALGVTIYFLATGKYPFYSPVPDELIAQIDNGKYQTDNIEDPKLVELISCCLSFNPQNRPTVKELLNMEYFKQFYDANPTQGRLSRSGSIGRNTNTSSSRLLLSNLITKPRSASPSRLRVHHINSLPSALIPIDHLQN